MSETKRMTPEEWVVWTKDNRIAWLEESNARLTAALVRIASLDDGPVVHGGFDEPSSAQASREALAAEWLGPCVHGRDPWQRCDRCSSAGAAVAWAMAARRVKR